jgi:hypothetical protein
MHLIGEYLLAEYIEANEQLSACTKWNHDYACPQYVYSADGTRRDKCWIDKLREMGIQVNDIHYDNVRKRDGIYYLIDLGHGDGVEMY